MFRFRFCQSLISILLAGSLASAHVAVGVAPSFAQLAPTVTPVKSVAAPTRTPIPKPPRRPATGILKDARRNGVGKLTFFNKLTIDATVWLTGSAQLPGGVLMYVRAGQSIVLSRIPAGSYDMRVGDGQRWDVERVIFIGDEDRHALQSSLIVDSGRDAKTKRYLAWQVLLEPDPTYITGTDGNGKTMSVAINEAPEKVEDAKLIRRLNTGTFLVNRARKGLGWLSIVNQSNWDGIFAITTTSPLSGSVVVAVAYVRAGEHFRINQIADGTYNLSYRIGNDWDSARRDFTQSATPQQLDRTLPYSTTRTSGGQRYSTWTVTIKAEKPNTTETAMGPREFWELLNQGEE